MGTHDPGDSRRLFPFLETDEIIADAEGSSGLTPQERSEAWISVQRMVEAIWSSLSEEEIRRRLEIGEKLEPRPDPWWRDVKKEGRR